MQSYFEDKLDFTRETHYNYKQQRNDLIRQSE